MENKNDRDFRLRSLADYEHLKKINQARSKTQSRYVRLNLKDNIREQSNGESAFAYFTGKIDENGLYLLDEPENSLSPENQIKLASGQNCQQYAPIMSFSRHKAHSSRILDNEKGCLSDPAAPFDGYRTR